MSNNTCVTVCPLGEVPEPSTGTCRLWHLSDIGLVYFPFLSTGALFSIVVCIGLFKKKAVLVKGRIEYKSF